MNFYLNVDYMDKNGIFKTAFPETMEAGDGY